MPAEKQFQPKPVDTSSYEQFPIGSGKVRSRLEKHFKSIGSTSYMDSIQREYFRNFLLQRKAALINDVDRTLGHMQDGTVNFPDLTDRATQEEEFSPGIENS